ncbi:hypothetical protein DQ04_03621040 [Trypanosoma grayi]|uniref:hypothetical protein n=1 Tax=Trypanosoma grayi TaxID=71804 RepID=UPI0004F4A767|nr:hypothetical protein DQ04_03621040 [Trypanosoma grayi]KEG10519.1 hypothetical protein DQ04_03621040 [Trypanosoma grayi]
MRAATGHSPQLTTHTAGASLPRRSRRAVLLLVVVLVVCACMPARGFRFTARPGRKCFTEQLQEPGRYELHYKMARSLTPFVSVAVTAPGGRAVVEHDVARPDAKEIVTIDTAGSIAVCFNVAEKAPLSASSLNITLEIMDAEDAELTRQKRQSYSTSSPIAVGVGKASGAMQQMQYIFDTMMRIRYAYISLMRVDDEMRYSFNDMDAVAWTYVYVFGAVALTITLVMYFRLRQYFRVRKYI